MITNATFYVYLISRLDGRPLYVGKGRGNRWRHHGKNGRNRHLISIIKQARAQGQELPRVKVWEGLTEEQALGYEKALIAFFGRADTGAGLLVNLTDGGEGASGYRYTDEQRARHGDIRRGRKLTPEWRASISKGMKDNPKVAANAAKAGAASRGSKKTTGWWSTEDGRAKQRQNNSSTFKKGHKHSPEAIEKIRAARLRQKNVSTATQFKVGYQPTPETRAKLSASIAAAWARRKSTAEKEA